MKLKTRKAISKRFKITKKKKMIRRPVGQNHFRAKKSGRKTLATRSMKKISPIDHKIFTKAIIY